MIVSGVANTPEEVRRYAACTLLSASLAESMTPDQNNPKENAIQACVDFLDKNEFIRLKPCFSWSPTMQLKKQHHDTQHLSKKKNSTLMIMAFDTITLSVAFSICYAESHGDK